MSTILKALKRLEEEKAAAAGRPLREEGVVADVGGPAGWGGRRWWIGAALCAVGVGAFLGWLPLEKPSSPPHPEPSAGTVPPAPRVAVRQEASSPTVAPAPATGVHRPAPPPEGRTPGTRAAAQPSTTARRLAAGAASRPDPHLATPEPKPALAAPDTSPGDPPAPSEMAQPASARTPAPERVAEPELATPPSRVARPHRLVAPERVATIPTPGVAVTRTLWHPDPGKRIAVVELKGRRAPLRLHEGDAVGPFVVREIKPAGVLFLRGSVEVLQRVGARP